MYEAIKLPLLGFQGIIPILAHWSGNWAVDEATKMALLYNCVIIFIKAVRKCFANKVVCNLYRSNGLYLYKVPTLPFWVSAFMFIKLLSIQYKTRTGSPNRRLSYYQRIQELMAQIIGFPLEIISKLKFHSYYLLWLSYYQRIQELKAQIICLSLETISKLKFYSYYLFGTWSVSKPVLGDLWRKSFVINHLTIQLEVGYMLGGLRSIFWNTFKLRRFQSRHNPTQCIIA